jgi:hypothetical protein
MPQDSASEFNEIEAALADMVRGSGHCRRRIAGPVQVRRRRPLPDGGEQQARVRARRGGYEPVGKVRLL